MQNIRAICLIRGSEHTKYRHLHTNMPAPMCLQGKCLRIALFLTQSLIQLGTITKALTQSLIQLGTIAKVVTQRLIQLGTITK